VFLYHPDDLKAIQSKQDRDRHQRHEVTPESQSACGYLSGLVKMKTCLERVLSGNVAAGRAGRKPRANARHILIEFAGLLEDSRLDDAESMRVLRRDEYWLGSVIRKCMAYAVRAVFWNHGKMLDCQRPDFYELGRATLGVTGKESMEELLEIFRSHFGLGLKPPSISNPPSEVASEVLEDQEIQPVLSAKKPEYALSWGEYTAVKRFVRPSQVRWAAGRLASYKKRGDLDGFLNTLHQIADGRRLTVGGNVSGRNEKKRRMGGFVSTVMTKALVGASCALEAASRVAQFMMTGEL
jgi:hypothetical protein